jgi:protein-arginine kinase activator protein McsA
VVEKAGLSADRIINAVAEGQDSLSAAVLRNKPSGKPQESRAKARQNALQKELNEVLSQENYERAAEIRDILHILEKQDGKSAPSA